MRVIVEVTEKNKYKIILRGYFNCERKLINEKKIMNRKRSNWLHIELSNFKHLNNVYVEAIENSFQKMAEDRLMSYFFNFL